MLITRKWVIDKIRKMLYYVIDLQRLILRSKSISL